MKELTMSEMLKTNGGMGACEAAFEGSFGIVGASFGVLAGTVTTGGIGAGAGGWIGFGAGSAFGSLLAELACN